MAAEKSERGSAAAAGGALRRAGERSECERGSASVIMLGLIGLAVGVLLIGAIMTGAATGRARAQTAADLGAIAAAGLYEQQRVTFADDPDAACARGASVAQRNGATMVSCDIHTDRSITIGVQTAAPFGLPAIQGTARAGPVDP